MVVGLVKDQVSNPVPFHISTLVTFPCNPLAGTPDHTVFPIKLSPLPGSGYCGVESFTVYVIS